MKTKLFFLALIVAVVLSACKGDKGDSGPSGSNGAANISNTLFTATPSMWIGPSPYFSIDVSVPAITDANKDVVEVYVQFAVGAPWFATPATSLNYSTDEYDFSFMNGVVTLFYINAASPPSTWYYRIVVVPPSIARDHPGVDYDNYSAVKAEFNLND